jgi:hypothetical protein
MEAGSYGKVNARGVPAAEPVAILRGSNSSTPRILDMAVTLAEAAGEPQEVIDYYTERAALMRDWQSEDPERTAIPAADDEA